MQRRMFFFLPPLDLHLPPRIPKREGQSGRQDLQFQAPLVNLRRSKPLFFPSFAEYTRARVAPFVFACSPLSFPRRVLRRGGSTIVFLVGAGWSASEHGAHADSRPGSVAPFPGGGKAVRSSKTSALFGFLSRGATCTAATISSFPRKASSQLCFFALLLKTLTTQSLSLSLSLSSFQDSSLFSFLLAEQLSCTAHTQKEQQKMNGRDASSDASMPLATRVQPTMSSKYNERSSFQRKLNMVRSSVISSCLQLRLVDDVARKPHNRWPEKEKQVDPPSKCLRSYD
jgi:hypothetical protein